MITTVTWCSAPAAVVDALLKDPGSWSQWSPHVASVEGPPGPVAAGWVGRTRAFFSPVATDMTVTWAEPGRGMRWTSTAFGHHLAYDNLVQAAPDGCTLTWSATLTGPAARLLEALLRPLSARGQRRRTTRLARLAETVARS